MERLRPLVFPPRWLRLLALLAFVFVAANLFWQGAQPYAVGLVPAPWDKLAHLTVYGGIGGTAWVMLGGGKGTADMLAPIAAVMLGVADEIAQSFNPGRVVSLDDVAADAAGALIVVSVLVLLRERLRAVEAPAPRR